MRSSFFKFDFKILIFFIFFLPLLARPEAKISKIIIQGNEKTKEEVIRVILRIHEGDPFTEETEETAARYLENQRKFSLVRVSSEPDGENRILNIFVKDKWSLVAVPYYSYRESGSSWGGAFLESNVLGYQNLFLLSIIREYGQWSGTFLFSHPRVLGSSFSYIAMASKKADEILLYSENREHGSFFRERSGGELTAKYQPWDEHYLMLSWNEYQVKDNLTLNQKFKSDRYLRFFVELDWTAFQGFFAQGTYLGLFYEQDLASELPHQVTGFKLEKFFNPAGKQNLYFQIHAFHMLKIAPGFEDRMGQDETVYSGPLRGYEKNQVSGESAVTVSTEYRIPLPEFWSLTIVGAPFFDLCQTSETHSSAGLALRVYFNSILVPALQIFAGYGIETDNYSLGISIGTRL